MHRSEGTLRAGTPLEKADAAVILVHGRGSSPDDIIGLIRYLPREGVAYLAPAAAGGAWYPQRFFAPLPQNEPDLGSALAVIHQLATECQAAGIPSSRLALAGFSQGACLVLEYTWRHPARYGWVAGLSGALIGPLDTPRPRPALLQTPVLIACAEQDAHIPVEHVRQTAAAFSEAGAIVTEQIYPGGAHTVFPAAVDWLRRQKL